MTLVVSISEFRQHIAEYIAKVQAGHKVILRDEKKDMEVVIQERKESMLRPWPRWCSRQWVFSR